jgi:hypothetical protein
MSKLFDIYKNMHEPDVLLAFGLFRINVCFWIEDAQIVSEIMNEEMGFIQYIQG